MARKTWVQIPALSLLADGLWASELISSNLGFLICERRIMALISWSHREDSKKWCLQEARHGAWGKAGGRLGVAPAGFAGSPNSAGGDSASSVHARRSQMLWLPWLSVPPLGCCWSHPRWGAGPFGHPGHQSFLSSWQSFRPAAKREGVVAPALCDTP